MTYMCLVSHKNYILRLVWAVLVLSVTIDYHTLSGSYNLNVFSLPQKMKNTIPGVLNL